MSKHVRGIIGRTTITAILALVALTAAFFWAPLCRYTIEVDKITGQVRREGVFFWLFPLASSLDSMESTEIIYSIREEKGVRPAGSESDVNGNQPRWIEYYSGYVSLFNWSMSRITKPDGDYDKLAYLYWSIYSNVGRINDRDMAASIIRDLDRANDDKNKILELSTKAYNELKKQRDESRK
jgi:hypothetical protein